MNGEFRLPASLSRWLKWMQACQTWIQSHRAVKIGVNTILVLFMVLLIGRYVWKDWNEISRIQVRVDGRALALMLALFAANFYILLASWHILVRQFGGTNHFLQNGLLYSYSQLYRFLPTPAWFLAARVYLYGQNGMRKWVVLGTTAVETILHILSGLMIYLLVFIRPNKPVTWLYGLALLIPIISLVGYGWLEKKMSLEKDIRSALTRRSFAAIFLLDLLTWVVAGPFFLSLIRSLGLDINLGIASLTQMWILSSIIAYIGSYTLGGVGVLREFSLVLLLSKALTPPVALLVIVYIRLVMTLGGILFSLLTIAAIKIIQASSKRRQTVNGGPSRG